LAAFSRRRSLALLGVILPLGVALRLLGLGRESLWLDEGFSLQFARMSLGEIFLLPDANPPLYYLFLHGWIRLFGWSEVALRLPSVVFGCLSLVVVYRVGRLIYGRGTGLVASLLLAVSPFHIYFSQEARTYSLTVLLCLLSTWFFLRIERGRRRDAAGYVLFSALFLSSHVYALFVLLAQNLYFLLLRTRSPEGARTSLGRWVLLQAGVAVPFLLWVRALVAHRAADVGIWADLPSGFDLLRTFRRFAGSWMLLGLVGLLIVLWFIRNQSRWRENLPRGEPRRAHFLGVWLLVPVIVPFVIARTVMPIYVIRYTIVASIPFLILVARGLVRIASRPLALVMTVGFVLLSGLAVAEQYWRVAKEPWRVVMERLDSHARGGDLVLYNGRSLKTLILYYSKREDVRKVGFPAPGKVLDEGNIAELDAFAEAHVRIWVILSHTTDKEGRIVGRLRTSHRLLLRNEYPRIDVYLFERAIQPRS
jgi:mannosyltransferase